MCDAYRGSAFPVDKALPKLNQENLSWFRQTLMDPNVLDLSLVHAGKAVGANILSFDNMTSFTKKIVIGSPRTVISEKLNGPNSLDTILLDHKTYQIYPAPGGLYPRYVTRRTYLYTANSAALYDWLRQSSAFLEDSTLKYRPLITRIEDEVMLHKMYRHGQDRLAFPSADSTTFETINTPHIGLPDGQIAFNDPNMVPLINLSLPTLENIDLGMLHKLMSDYPEELCAFRDFLHQKIEEMRSKSIESETFYSDVRSIEREIRSELRKLNSDIKKAKIKTALESAGVVIAAWTLAFYLVLSNDANVLTFLGPSGAVVATSKVVSDYLNNRLALKENAAYFLWVVGKTGA